MNEIPCDVWSVILKFCQDDGLSWKSAMGMNRASRTAALMGLCMYGGLRWVARRLPFLINGITLEFDQFYGAFCQPLDSYLRELWKLPIRDLPRESLVKCACRYNAEIEIETAHWGASQFQRYFDHVATFDADRCLATFLCKHGERQKELVSRGMLPTRSVQLHLVSPKHGSRLNVPVPALGFAFSRKLVLRGICAPRCQRVLRETGTYELDELRSLTRAQLQQLGLYNNDMKLMFKMSLVVADDAALSFLVEHLRVSEILQSLRGEIGRAHV